MKWPEPGGQKSPERAIVDAESAVRVLEDVGGAPQRSTEGTSSRTQAQERAAKRASGPNAAHASAHVPTNDRALTPLTRDELTECVRAERALSRALRLVGEASPAVLRAIAPVVANAVARLQRAAVVSCFSTTNEDARSRVRSAVDAPRVDLEGESPDACHVARAIHIHEDHR